MSRSGYSDDCDDNWAHIRWRGAVKSAIRGSRGQAFMKELAAALDAMPEKHLIANELETADGEFCALGVLGKTRGIDMKAIDPDDAERVAGVFNIAPCLAREIVYENDESVATHDYVDVEICGPMPRIHPKYSYAPQEHRKCVRVDRPHEMVTRRRWAEMRKWVADNLIENEKEGAQ